MHNLLPQQQVIVTINLLWGLIKIKIILLELLTFEIQQSAYIFQ